VTAPGLRHRALVLAAALLFSTGGAAIKWAGLTGWQIASGRSAVAAIALYLVMPEARRAWSWRLVPVAAAYAATLVTFALANRLTTSADAIFLQATAPLYILLLGPWLLKERVTRADVVYMAVVLAGMAVFFLGSESAVATAPDPPKGNILAAASGVCFALVVVGLRWLSRGGKQDAGVATVALGNVLAALSTLPMALPCATLAGRDIAILLYLGVVQIGLAYLCLTRGIGHVPAVESGTLLMLEPAMNPVWTWMVHGERPGGWALAGGMVIIFSTLVNTWRQSRARTAPA